MLKKVLYLLLLKAMKQIGHNYIEQAIECGAIAILIEEGVDLKKTNIPESVTVIVSENTRYALAYAACNFYGNPSRKFKLIGVTGTKGKTTTCFMIKKLLEKQGYKVRFNRNYCKLYRK